MILSPVQKFYNVHKVEDKPIIIPRFSQEPELGLHFVNITQDKTSKPLNFFYCHVLELGITIRNADFNKTYASQTFINIIAQIKLNSMPKRL